MNRVYKAVLIAAVAASCALAQQVPKALDSTQLPGNSLVYKTYSSQHPSVVAQTLSGKWWTRPDIAQTLGLSAEQQKRMDDVLQQHRLKLIDVQATLEKEEVTLEPLVAAEPPDNAKVLAQIDRVANARAELEKANARMLWELRRILTPEQWSKLQTSKPASFGYYIRSK